MKQIDLATGKEAVLLPEETLSCAIGNFDGVHLGHKALILRAASRPGGATKSAVWTFSEPSSRLLDGKIGLLTTMEERLSLFRALGIDLVFLEDFDSVRNVEAHSFAENILYRQCQVRTAVCGFNFHYGKNAAGTAETLSESFRLLGGHAEIIPPCKIDGIIVSSSEIRAALAAGDVGRAAAMLDRPYSLTAVVREGKRLGHRLGFPTINQLFPVERALPRFGVYATRAAVDGKRYYGVSNVGVRPTVEHTTQANCETYILDFDGNLYGKTVKVEFCHFLRPEEKFESPTALRDAISQNITQTRAFFHLTESRL